MKRPSNVMTCCFLVNTSCVEKLKLFLMLVYERIVFGDVFVTNMIACEGRFLCITAILWYILSVFYQTEFQQKQSLKLRLKIIFCIIAFDMCFMDFCLYFPLLKALFLEEHMNS